MPSTRRALGSFGEQLARSHLIRQGYTIVAQNWRCRLGEIDLVARMGDQLVFVEVRTRRADGPIAPEESLSAAKRRRLIVLAAAFLADAQLPDSTPARIDLVAICVDRGGRLSRLSHIADAVEAA